MLENAPLEISSCPSKEIEIFPIVCFWNAQAKISLEQETINLAGVRTLEAGLISLLVCSFIFLFFHRI